VVEMYCPIVLILPSLCGSMPSNVFSVVFCKSGINVKFHKLVKKGEHCFEGFLWYS